MIPNLKLIGAGAAVAALIGSHIWAYWHGRGAEKAIQQAEYIKALEAKDKAIQRQQSITKQVTHDHQIQVAELDAKYRDAARRIGPVRVRACPTGSLPAASPAAGGAAATPTGTDLPRSPARDIGPDLIGLAKDADDCAVRLRSLQDWNRRQASH